MKNILLVLACLFMSMQLEAQPASFKIQRNHGESAYSFWLRVYNEAYSIVSEGKEITYRNEESRLDSANTYEWDRPISAWIFDGQYIYSSSATADISLFLNPDYEMEYLDSVVYDQEGRRIRYHTLSWSGTEWESLFLIAYTYNAQGSLAETVFHFDNGGGLEAETRSVFTYDANNYLVENVRYAWEDAWVQTRRTLYENTAEGLLAVSTDQVWNAAWENESRLTYTYGNDNELQRTVLDYWYGYWEIGSAYDYLYNAQLQLIEEIEGFYVTGVLYQRYKIEYEYDLAGNLIGEYNFKEVEQAWENTYQYLYTFDENNNLVTYLTQDWEVIWTNADSIQYYYSTISAVAEKPVVHEISLYPNPVTNTVYWATEHVSTTNHVNVYNTHGQLLQLPLELGVGQLHVSSLLPGMYLLELPTDKGMSRTRFIKQ